MYAQVETVAEMKEKLSNAPGSLMLVGGAMMHTHPEMMKELFEWIPTGNPTMVVDVVFGPDFEAVVKHAPPFTPAEVAAASVYAIEQIVE